MASPPPSAHLSPSLLVPPPSHTPASTANTVVAMAMDAVQATALRTDKAFKKRVLAALKVRVSLELMLNFVHTVFHMLEPHLLCVSNCSKPSPTCARTRRRSPPCWSFVKRCPTSSRRRTAPSFQHVSKVRLCSLLWLMHLTLCAYLGCDVGVQMYASQIWRHRCNCPSFCCY